MVPGANIARHKGRPAMTALFTPAKSSHTAIRIILPCLPESAGATEKQIYMGFIQALRAGAGRRMEVRILTAIHRAADLTGNSDAYVSRVLADMGLMAPRLAFPGDFLDHVDATFLRTRPLRTIPPAYAALAHHWMTIGEDLYALSGLFRGSAEELHSFLAPA
jgi:hypothetical protein